jgi:hypothetical protein
MARIELPTPARSRVHEDSLAAMLQDLLDIAAPDSDPWKRGYAAFWVTLAQGKSAGVDTAFRVAVEAAADGAPNKAALVKKAMDEYQKWCSPAEPSASQGGPRGFFAEIAAAFGSRRPAAHR